MSIDEFVKHLSCLRCGSRNDLTYYKYTNSYRYKTGGYPVYTIHRVTNSLKMPICRACLPKIKRWKIFFYSIIVIFAIWIILSSVLPRFVDWYPPLDIGYVACGGLLFASAFIFLLAHLNNPRSYVKFKSDIAYVRPVGSNKWINFNDWARVNFSDFFIFTESRTRPINPVVRKFPLIGGIIILISLLTPSFIYINSNDIFTLSWIPLIDFTSSVTVWEPYYGLVTKAIFSFNYMEIISVPNIFSLVVYIVFAGCAFVTVQKSYILKRAGSYIPRIGTYMLVLGSLCIILIIVYLFIFLPTSYTGTFIISSGVYGILAGSFLTILGPAIQKLNLKFNFSERTFCPSCGKAITNGTDFCGNCGNHLYSDF